MSEKNLDGQRYLEFQLGSESYAVELVHVREVITPPELTPIPKAPAHVCGLMNLRGLVLTVIDLRKKLGITPDPQQQESAVIIFDLGDRLVGAWVDSIYRVMSVPADSQKPVPESENSSVTQNLHGVLQFQNKLTLWLDIKKLLGSAPLPGSRAA
jgi:purine-binding chemotaxis protein CheW